MSTCDKLVTSAAASQGCDCIKYDPATGTLTANGVAITVGGAPVSGPVSPTAAGIAGGALNPLVTIAPTQLQAGVLPTGVLVPAAQITGTLPASAIPPVSPTASGISGGALNPLVTVAPSQLQAGALPANVTVDAAQITGVLPAAAIPCAAVLACVSAAPAGSIPAAAIAPGDLAAGVNVSGGTVGQVLTSDGTKGVWAAPTGAPAAGPVSPTASGISAGALNPAVTVDGSQIVGTLPAAAIPCSAVLACVSAAPAGSIPASALSVGTAGQVLTTDATGAAVWAAPAATPVGGPISPTAAGISGGALNPAVTVAPSQLQPGAIPAGTTIDAAQVTGVLPASAIPCSAVLACVTAGSLPASAIASGTAGQVLTTDAAGATVWAAPTAAPAPGPVSPTASGISGGALNPAVTVDASQIVGTLPASAIPCSAVLACITAAPAGSIPADKLTPGTAGQVLVTDASGQTAWAAPTPAAAPTAAQIATAMDSATVTTSPGTAASVAQVYGENATGAPVTATPMQVFEAGMAAAPLSTAAAPVAMVSGVNAAGTEVKTTVQPVGAKTVGVSSPATNAPATAGANYVIATVAAPEAGMYSVQVNHSYNSIYAGGPAVGINANQHEWYITTSGGRIYDRIITDYAVSGAAQPAGANVATDTEKLTIGQFKLNAGENVLLQVYVNSATAPHNLTANGGLTLIKGADNDLATPSAV